MSTLFAYKLPHEKRREEQELKEKEFLKSVAPSTPPAKTPPSSPPESSGGKSTLDDFKVGDHVEVIMPNSAHKGTKGIVTEIDTHYGTVKIKVTQPTSKGVSKGDIQGWFPYNIKHITDANEAPKPVNDKSWPFPKGTLVELNSPGSIYHGEQGIVTGYDAKTDNVQYTVTKIAYKGTPENAIHKWPTSMVVAVVPAKQTATAPSGPNIPGNPSLDVLPYPAQIKFGDVFKMAHKPGSDYNGTIWQVMEQATLGWKATCIGPVGHMYYGSAEHWSFTSKGMWEYLGNIKGTASTKERPIADKDKKFSKEELATLLPIGTKVTVLPSLGSSNYGGKSGAVAGYDQSPSGWFVTVKFPDMSFVPGYYHWQLMHSQGEEPKQQAAPESKLDYAALPVLPHPKQAKVGDLFRMSGGGKADGTVWKVESYSSSSGDYAAVCVYTSLKSVYPVGKKSIWGFSSEGSLWKYLGNEAELLAGTAQLPFPLYSTVEVTEGPKKGVQGVVNVVSSDKQTVEILTLTKPPGKVEESVGKFDKYPVNSLKLVTTTPPIELAKQTYKVGTPVVVANSLFSYFNGAKGVVKEVTPAKKDKPENGVAVVKIKLTEVSPELAAQGYQVGDIQTWFPYNLQVLGDAKTEERAPAKEDSASFHIGDEVEYIYGAYPKWVGTTGTVKHYVQETDTAHLVATSIPKGNDEALVGEDLQFSPATQKLKVIKPAKAEPAGAPLFTSKDQIKVGDWVEYTTPVAMPGTKAKPEPGKNYNKSWVGFYGTVTNTTYGGKHDITVHFIGPQAKIKEWFNDTSGDVTLEFWKFKPYIGLKPKQAFKLPHQVRKEEQEKKEAEQLSIYHKTPPAPPSSDKPQPLPKLKMPKSADPSTKKAMLHLVAESAIPPGWTITPVSRTEFDAKLVNDPDSENVLALADHNNKEIIIPDDATDEVESLLIAHEVGHALYEVEVGAKDQGARVFNAVEMAVTQQLSDEDIVSQLGIDPRTVRHMLAYIDDPELTVEDLEQEAFAAEYGFQNTGFWVEAKKHVFGYELPHNKRKKEQEIKEKELLKSVAPAPASAPKQSDPISPEYENVFIPLKDNMPYADNVEAISVGDIVSIIPVGSSMNKQYAGMQGTVKYKKSDYITITPSWIPDALKTLYVDSKDNLAAVMKNGIDFFISPKHWAVWIVASQAKPKPTDLFNPANAVLSTESTIDPITDPKKLAPGMLIKLQHVGNMANEDYDGAQAVVTSVLGNEVKIKWTYVPLAAYTAHNSFYGADTAANLNVSPNEWGVYILADGPKKPSTQAPASGGFKFMVWTNLTKHPVFEYDTLQDMKAEYFAGVGDIWKVTSTESVAKKKPNQFVTKFNNTAKDFYVGLVSNNPNDTSNNIYSLGPADITYLLQTEEKAKPKSKADSLFDPANKLPADTTNLITDIAQLKSGQKVELVMLGNDAYPAYNGTQGVISDASTAYGLTIKTTYVPEGVKAYGSASPSVLYFSINPKEWGVYLLREG